MGAVKEFYSKSENKWNKMEKRALIDYLKEKKENKMNVIYEEEWYSNCCDAPPLYTLHIEKGVEPIGKCMACREGAAFYIEEGEKNDK